MNFTDWISSLTENERVAITNLRDAEAGWNAAMLAAAESEPPDVTDLRFRLLDYFRGELTRYQAAAATIADSATILSRDNLQAAIQLLSVRVPIQTPDQIAALKIAVDVLCSVDHPREAAQLDMLLGRHGNRSAAEHSCLDQADRMFVDRQAAVDAVLSGTHELWLDESGASEQTHSGPLQDRSRPLCKIEWRDGENVERPFWTLAKNQAGTILGNIVGAITPTKTKRSRGKA